MTGSTLILIVDDDPIFLGIVASMVQHLGYSVITATDGYKALELFRQQPEAISWVILDINMPKMDGISMFQNLRNLHQKTKVIIVSGTLNENIQAKLSPLCPHACLTKPITLASLTKALNLE